MVIFSNIGSVIFQCVFVLAPFVPLLFFYWFSKVFFAACFGHFWSAPFSLKKKDGLLQWVVFFQFTLNARLDPLTSILDAMARSCQILTTSWQPWIPWQDSY